MRPTRDRIHRAAVAIATLVLLGAGAAFCISQGPLTLRAPASVVSNAHWVMKAAEPFLLWLASLRERLPAGATVVVLSPESKDDSPTGVSYLVPLGQLPAQRVVPWTVLRDPAAVPPRYVAVFRRGFHDARYRLVSQTSDDQLWELAAAQPAPSPP